MTIAGKLSDDLAPGTLNSVLRQAGLKKLKFLVVIEKTETGYSAYSPDLPGCVATGNTRSETEGLMREAIQFHVEGLRDDGQEVPEATSSIAYVEVAA